MRSREKTWVRYTRGQIIWGGLEDRIDGWRSAQRGGWESGGGCFFIPPPSPFLLVFSARTDRRHMGRAFSPVGLLFRLKPHPIFAFRPALPFPPGCIRFPGWVDLATCFDYFRFFPPRYVPRKTRKKERKKRILFVLVECSGQSIDGELIGSCHIRDSV